MVIVHSYVTVYQRVSKDTSCSTYRTSFDRNQKFSQKHDETRIAVIQVTGCYKAWFLVPANQASTRASHRWESTTMLFIWWCKNLGKQLEEKSFDPNKWKEKTYNILRWPCHRNFCDILAPWLAPSPLFRLRSAQPSRVFWIQRPTVNVVSNTWWGKWLRLLTHGGTWKIMTVILKMAEIVQLRESSDSIPLASQKWLGLLTIPWLIPARKKPRKCGFWITFGGFLKWG
jgi:hypothetical protein